MQVAVLPGPRVSLVCLPVPVFSVDFDAIKVEKQLQFSNCVFGDRDAVETGALLLRGFRSTKNRNTSEKHKMS